MKILVKVPATTANLGPGFDALGLALDLWNETQFSAADDGQIKVTVSGEGAGRLSSDSRNPIVASVLKIYDLLQTPCPGLRIDCVNHVPVGSGLGSSSTALLAGLLGGNALLGNPLGKDEILKLAVDAEGHPDNVAPAMLGGLVASIMCEGRAVSRKLSFGAGGPSVYITIVLPCFNFPTKKARAILPKRVDFQDSIYNISRAVLVTEALRAGDLELLGQSMSDALHQPYRLPLIPGAQTAMGAARRAGAAAVALSGAGPSLVAFSAKRDSAVGLAMQQAFEAAGLPARIFELGVSDQGAKVDFM